MPVHRQNSVHREEGMLHAELERYTQQTQGLCALLNGGLAGLCFFFSSGDWLPLSVRCGLSVVVQVLVIWQTSSVSNAAN